MASLLVVIPTYNEAVSIAEAIERTLRAAPDAQILVVDDGSPDGTAKIVEEIMATEPRVKLMARASKMGLGRAYVAGFGWGLERGFDLFVEMDADLSHDPADIPRLVDAIATNDLVIGSRYVEGGGVEGWSWGRHLLSKAGNLYSRLALRLGIRDSTSGLRCYRRETLERIGLRNVVTDGYAFQIDMANRARSLGLRIKEVPIIFTERATGESKMSRRIVWEAIVLVTSWALRRPSR